MGEATTPDRVRSRRKVRFVALASVGGLVLIMLAALASALYGADRIPWWGLALALLLVAAVAVPLVVLGLREFVGVVQHDVLAPYGVQAPPRAAALAAAMVVAAALLGGVVLTDLVTGTARWIVAGLLATATVVFCVLGWRSGYETRRRVKAVRRERGYLAGEQPWSWWAHAGYGATSIGLIALQVGNGLLNDSVERWRWFFWAAALMFVVMFLSIAWSAMQKWRREQRGRVAR
ncbi:hypothetical protein [Nocardioides zeae]